MTSETITRQPRGGTTGRRWYLPLAIAWALALLALRPSPALAGEDGAPAGGRSLDVTVSYPDDGLTDGEQVCLALFPGDAADLSAAPLQSRCLDPGEETATFGGLKQGAYQVIVPGPGSIVGSGRYQGQRLDTEIPDDPDVSAYGFDVELALSSEAAGITGRVEVNVFGCPPGTNAGGDATLWASECNAVAAGIPLSLSGVGTIEDTAKEGITGIEGAESGKVEFTNLPAGAYQLAGELPANVADTPALFVESSIDGSLGPIAPDEPLSVRPSEIVAVNVYLVLEEESAPGAGNLDVAGGLSPDAAAELAERNADEE